MIGCHTSFPVKNNDKIVERFQKIKFLRKDVFVIIIPYMPEAFKETTKN